MTNIIVTACDINDIDLLRLVLAGEYPEYCQLSKEEINEGLIRASVHGYRECAELLLDAGADIDCTDEDNETPLTLAVGNNHVELIEYFLTKPLDINKRNGDFLAPLHIAASQGYKIIAEMLLAAGANKSVENFDFETPFLYAVLGSHLDLVKVFLKADCNVNDRTPGLELLIHLAAERDNYEICRLLIEAGADVNEETAFEFLPLHFAAVNNNVEIMELLINAGADINASGSFGKETVLHRACSSGSMDCVNYILNDKNFVGIDDVDEHGLTAVGRAIVTDCLPIAIRLIKDGASANSRFINYPDHGMRQQTISFEDCCPHLIAACLAEDRLEMANILFMSGQYTFQEVREQLALLQPHQFTEEIRDWMKEIFRPLPLINMCRSAVNSALWIHVLDQCKTSSKKSLPVVEQRKQNIQALPIPTEMKNFLLFSDLQ